jgi:hypothetical protein
MAFNYILSSMTIDSVPVPVEWYQAIASKGGKAVSKTVRSKASLDCAPKRWATRRKRYGKAGHAGPYAERKAKAT